MSVTTQGGKQMATNMMEDVAAGATTLVHYEAQDGVAILTLDDPPANTYTYELMQDLDRCILRARMDESVYVIVLVGQGEKFFCAGASIPMLNSVTPQFKYYFCLHANETLNRLEQTPKLVIAALNGHTVGGGLEIAMAADLRIARRGGGKIGLPEVNLGVLPGTGGTQRLARIVGKTSAIELMVTGRTFEFDEAQQMGIVTEIYDAADRESFLNQVLDYAKRFTPPNMASKAVGNIKRAVQTGAELPFQDALAVERELQQQLFQSEDAKEGIAAYVEKRKAQFKAR
jgi:enoyl-CoA hydratase